jgi:hypothetical protein
MPIERSPMEARRPSGSSTKVQNEPRSREAHEGKSLQLENWELD